jgi:hypothetical protein
MAKNWGAKFDATRLREAKAAFRAIAEVVDPGGKRVGAAWENARAEVQDGFRAAALIVRNKARAGAASVGAPKRLYSGDKPAIFAFSDFRAATDDKRKRAVLVGMRTGLSTQAKDPSLFIAWGKGATRRKGGTVAARGLSMSLAALFERGRADRRIKPGRFFRSAIFSTRSTVARLLTSAYAKAVGTINRIK